MLRKSKIIIIFIILIALIIAILSIYLINRSIKYDNTENTIKTNANVANELYINSNNTIFNPNISNQIATTTDETISSKIDSTNSTLNESKKESIPQNTNEQKQKNDIKTDNTTNKSSNTLTTNKKDNSNNSNNDSSNSKTVPTETETQPKQDPQNTTVKTEENDTSHLANKTYRKPNTAIVPEIISILKDEISKHPELVEYGTKAVSGKKSDAYKNTTGFTYIFVNNNKKLTQRVRNNVGAFGTYYVYAEDEYTYNSSGKNPKWSQTLVWIWVSF